MVFLHHIVDHSWALPAPGPPSDVIIDLPWSLLPTEQQPKRLRFATLRMASPSPLPFQKRYLRGSSLTSSCLRMASPEVLHLRWKSLLLLRRSTGLRSMAEGGVPNNPLLTMPTKMKQTSASLEGNSEVQVVRLLRPCNMKSDGLSWCMCWPIFPK